MIKVLRPSKNKQTQGYSDGHKGYDHSGKGDQNYYSSIYGKVTQSKNSETENWQKKKGEKLTTKDYGNYIKIKGEVDGKVVYQLGAHFKQGTVLSVGTEVSRGQVVAQVGNTGNSTAKHSHTEYRDSGNKNFSVTFVENEEEDKPMDTQTKEQIIIDVYKAETGEYPTDDEKKWRLQQNLNTVELIESVHGDGRFHEKWVAPHVGDKTDLKEQVETYKDQKLKLNEVLRPVGIPSGADFAEAVGKVSWLVEQYKDTENKIKDAEDRAKEAVASENYMGQVRFLGAIIRFLIIADKKKNGGR